MVFWDVPPCILEKWDKIFRGRYSYYIPPRRWYCTFLLEYTTDVYVVVRV